MPFGLKIKRAKRYNVSTKNCYVVCVHLLDNTLIECTLSHDSTGQDCMDNIAQRIELVQTEYFGLKYANKKLQYRWLDLEKPLKKQLDKNADSHMLYFGVMFYVSNAEKIQDEMTRYQYYLQLKTDVIEGKIVCTEQQAVVLGSYSVQAEFGDHDPDRHSVEFLRQFVLLPRSMTTEDRVLADLTGEVVAMHKSLQGVAPTWTEQQYIIEVQQLEGYGTEYFPAKDDSGSDIYLGAAHIGVYVKYMKGQPQEYLWSDINSLSHNKKTFSITPAPGENPVHFQLEDPDTAKYMWRLCCMLHQFFKANKHNIRAPEREVSVDAGSVGPLPDLQQSVQQSSAEQRDMIDTPVPLAHPQTPTVDMSTQPMLIPQQKRLDEIYSQSQQSLDRLRDLSYMNSVYLLQGGEPASPAPALHHQTTILPQTPGTPLSYTQRTSSVVPQYRPSPDYNTIMQQRLERLQQQQQQLQHHLHHGDISEAQVYAQPETLAYSQPEIGHTQSAYTQYYANPSLYTNAYLELHTNANNGHHHQQHSMHYGKPVDRTSSLIIHPTYSTPELNNHSLATHFSTSENLIADVISHYRPPPYPRSSSSTPDLATQPIRSNLSNSPDLVSRKHINNNNALIMQSRFDQSVENLAADTRNLQLHQQMLPMPRPLDESSSSHSGSTFARDAVLSDMVATDYAHNGIGVSSAAGTYIVTMSEDLANAAGISVQQPPQSAYSFHTTPSVSSQNILQLDSQTQQLNYINALASQQQQQQQQQLQLAQAGSCPSSQPHNHMPPPSYAISAGSQSGVSSYSAVTPGQANHLEQHTTSSIDHRDLPPPLIGVSNNNMGLTPAHCKDNTAATADNDSETMECLDTTKVSSVSSDHGSVAGHSQTSSMDTSSNMSESYSTARDSQSDNNKSPCHPSTSDVEEDGANKRLSMGPLKLAAMNGLSVSRASVLEITPVDDTRAPKDERRRNLENKLEEGQVFKEFEQIPKKRVKSDCIVANNPNNKDRNRFKDVHPYDDNRIKLTPTKDNPMGYINASHIKMRIKQEEWWYISSQGPLVNTVLDFWQMVWEQGVEVVAMLTGLTEQGKEKCHKYWPDKSGAKNRVKCGEYQITLQFSNNSGIYITQGLNVRHIPTGKQRLVWHLQYTGWPDHGCPEDTDGFLSYMNEIESVRRHAFMERKDGRRTPVVVHCSAGVGRSGVVILAEIMKACLEYNENVDIPTVLRHMREQRMFMVQTVSQYTFVYKTLVQYLQGSRLI